MTWRRGDLVWAPSGDQPWARHSALQPSPLVLDDRVRVYCGVRDDGGRSSVAWVDLALDDPTTVLAEATSPTLSRGDGDAWDRDGVVPTCLVRAGDAIRMYYAGYERVDDPLVRFRVFAGLAVSLDGGVTFERVGDAGGQVLFARPGEELFSVIHSVLPDADGGWRVWYGAGGSFVQGERKALPVYDIRAMSSADGIEFPQVGTTVLGLSGEEHRVGRPYVVGRDPDLEMFFGASTERIPYGLAWAQSHDGGSSWRRDDQHLGELLHPGTWDAQMAAYPAVIDTPNGRVMFYNGDDYGRRGFGIAYES